MSYHWLLLLLSLEHIVPSHSDKGAFSYVLSSSAVDPVYGVRLDSTVPAVDLALDYINSNSTLLPGVNITYGEVGWLACPLQDGMLEEILDDANVGVLGYSCCDEVSTDNLVTADIFNSTPVIQYTAISADLLYTDTDSASQPALFTVHPTPRTYAEALVALIEQFGWQRFVTITDLAGEGFFKEVLNNTATLAQSNNITLFESDINSTTGSIIPQDVRIVFLNVKLTKAVQVMCKAFNSGSVFPRYVWITYSGDHPALATDTTATACSSNQLALFLDGVLTLSPAAGNGAVSEDAYEVLRVIQRTPGFSLLSYFAFDATLVLAQAVNDTLAGWSNNSPDWSFCEEEHEANRISLAKCFVRQKILNINISGVTGEIGFNSHGNRVINIIEIHQYRYQGDLNEIQFRRDLVAQVTVNASDHPVVVTEFEFVSGENETTIFRGTVPSDGTPIKNFNQQPLQFVIVFYIIATVGIAFALLCLFFNILFRKRKIVKLISPTLNYFVITGALMLYALVYVRILPIENELYVHVACNLQTFLTCIGYVLCFAPVLMKMLRVYYIFHNPSPTKKTLKDWHLVLGTSIMVAIITVLVFISFAVPALRGRPRPIQDIERPYGTTEDGIRIENCIYQCYGFSLSLAWIALEYFYLLLLQVAAFVLAVLTRNVTIKVLNDSKEMIIIVYSSSTIMLILGIFTFALSTRFILQEIMFSGLIMLATTIFITVLFVPKMVDLYKDPRGEGVFGKTTESTSTANQYKSNVTYATQSANFDNSQTMKDYKE